VQRLPFLLNRVQDIIARHGPRRYLFALTGTQEVRAEALVKDLEPFSRFLNVAALPTGR
jgi:hypothetical protein